MTAGAVLCGGSSRRMGRDKALVEIDGVPMARRVAAALRDAGCFPVVAVGGDPRSLSTAGLEVVPDLHPGEGPLGGIITALRWSPEPSVVVAACDLPWLDASTVESLLVPDGHVRVARTARREPMCAHWPVTALAPLEAAFAAGERAVHRALAALDVVEVVAPRAALRNVNNPADVAGR